jgi:hypothetical protein
VRPKIGEKLIIIFFVVLRFGLKDAGLWWEGILSVLKLLRT